MRNLNTNKNKKTFFKFFAGEIPNIVQIVGIPSLFGIISIKYLVIKLVLIPFVSGFLLSVYLTHKSYEYLECDIEKVESWTTKLAVLGISCVVFSVLILLSGS